MKNEKKATNTTTFAELLRTYETATLNRNNGNPESETLFTTALQTLATACTFSVLKKLENVGGYVTETSNVKTDSAKVIRELKRTLAKDLHDLNRLQYATENATELQYNPEGELQRVIVDSDLNKASKKLASQTFSGDGLDLVNTAIVTILNETAKTDLSPLFMETPYSVRRLKKKVYIKDISSLGGYETVETTPIQEVYKAIRREIQANRTMQVANSKYTYIADVLKDTETDTETAVYKRLPKYSGLAYEQTDINGKVTAITSDIVSTEKAEMLITSLNLTTKQAKVLELRLSGYGQKAIATYMGVSKQAVQCTLKAIQEKATAKGLAPVIMK